MTEAFSSIGDILVTSASIGDIPVITPGGETVALTYSSPTDDNDLFYYLGTKGGAEAWSNPAVKSHGWLTLHPWSWIDTPRRGLMSTDRNAATYWHSLSTDQERGMVWSLPYGKKMKVARFGMQSSNADWTLTPRAFKIQGSDDLRSWVDLITVADGGHSANSEWRTWTSATDTAYRHLRLRQAAGQYNYQPTPYQSFASVKFWGELEVADDPMAGWSHPIPEQIFGADGILRSGGVTASAVGTQSGSPANAFDESTSTYWHSDNSTSGRGLKFALPAPFIPYEIHLMSRHDLGNPVFVDAKLQGSHNGTDWYDIEVWGNNSFSPPYYWYDEGFGVNITARRSISTSEAWEHLRIVEANTYMIATEIEFYGRTV